MATSEAANLPRWRGQPGFFEIWFLVVFEPDAGRAYWLRYTTFAPAPGAGGAPRATVWAAAFDAAAAAPTVALKAIHPAAAYDGGGTDRFAVRVDGCELRNDRCRGEVRSGERALAWALELTPARREARRGPWLLDRLPLPTHVAHANSDVAFDGWVEVDGQRRVLRGAPGLQKHLWGTRRVEELYWLYCPRFAEAAGVRLEASSARLRRGGPGVASVWLGTAAGEMAWRRIPTVFRNRVEPSAAGELRVCAVSPTREITARAWCDPRTLAGYVYRDPAGWDVHVAQSDVGSCEAEVRTRLHPLAAWSPARRLSVRHAAAIEFHAPDPLPGVEYIPWDGTAPWDGTTKVC